MPVVGGLVDVTTKISGIHCQPNLVLRYKFMIHLNKIEFEKNICKVIKRIMSLLLGMMY